MTKKSISLLVATSAMLSFASGEKAASATNGVSNSTESQHSEKPIKHLNLPEITSKEKAMEVMTDTTKQLKSKTKLDAGELGQIHMITYSLEKAIAYFAENTEGTKKQIAEKMAVVVEEVHLNSENNKAEETKTALSNYFKLAQSFI